MTTAGNEANLRAMIDPVRKYFDGLNFTFHYPKDAGSDYLEEQKGDGRIVYAEWCKRHGYSMTHFLWQGTMEDGDKLVLLDSAERISEKFCKERLPEIVKMMDNDNVAMVAHDGKGLVFRFNEQMEFRGSPHWGLIQVDGLQVNTHFGPDEFWNVRNEQRDPFQWVFHYAKYFLYPQGSNHALLGLDHHKGDPKEIFVKRETKRLWFLTEMRKSGFPRTLDGLQAFLSQPLTDDIKKLINSDKVWSDYYHYVVLGDKTVTDNHDPETMKVVK